MIRTKAVDLTVLDAVAFRQKIPSGGSGITIIRRGLDQPGIASISTSTGDAIPAANTNTEFFPAEAFREAMALTAGLPYRKLSGIKKLEEKPVIEEAPAEEKEEIAVDSEAYLKILEQYTDRTGKLSYDLLNRDLIQSARGSKQVQELIAEMAPEDDICFAAAANIFRGLTKNADKSDSEIRGIIALLDEVSPKHVFRPLKEEVRKWLKESKRQ